MTRMTTMTRVSQFWDQIEIWGFREDIKDVKGIGLMIMTTIISALFVELIVSDGVAFLNFNYLFYLPQRMMLVVLMMDTTKS